MSAVILQQDDKIACYELVVRAYDLILRRVADPAGIDSNVSFLAGGGKPGVFLSGLLASEEFHNLGISSDPRELCVHYWVTNIKKHGIRPVPPIPSLDGSSDTIETLLQFLTCHEVRRLPLDQGVLRCNDLRAYHYWRSLVAQNVCKTEQEVASLPPLSFVVRVERSHSRWKKELRGLLASFQIQTDSNWHLCILSSDRFIRSYCLFSLARDHRVSLARTGRDIKTTGWTAVLEVDDRLEPDACALIGKALTSASDAGLIYADEDVRDRTGYRNPWTKEKWIRYKTHSSFLTGLILFRRDLSERLFQDFLATGRITVEMVSSSLRTEQIRHLPAILLHRARQVSGDVRPALLRLPPHQPSVSIIIPTKDKPGLIRRVLEAIYYRTNYPHVEIVVVDNGTTDEDAKSVLLNAGQRANVTVVNAPGPFNWSHLNNVGVAHSKGDVVVLLNNDVDVINALWLDYLIAPLMQQDIGITGAVLLFADGTVQHAGVDLEVGPKATHVGIGETFSENVDVEYDVPAVTGACLAIRRTLFNQIGGLEEALPVTWNDIDLCLRARRAGKRVVIVPSARLRHDESSTRLPDTDVSQRRTVKKAQQFIQQRYGQELGAWKPRNSQVKGFGPYERWSLDYARYLVPKFDGLD
nr:glycosyltransferase family 2 protein [Gluconobacter oxydans]